MEAALGKGGLLRPLRRGSLGLPFAPPDGRRRFTSINASSQVVACAPAAGDVRCDDVRRGFHVVSIHCGDRRLSRRRHPARSRRHGRGRARAGARVARVGRLCRRRGSRRALVWSSVAAAGLAALAATFAPVFIVVRYAGAAWLLYLAWKLWTAPPRTLTVSGDIDEGRGLFLAGLALNLGNPKAIVFFLALLPSVVELGGLTPLAFAELAGVIVAVVGGVFSAYVLLAARLHRLFASPRALRLVNRGSSVAVADAAVAVAAR